MSNQPTYGLENAVRDQISAEGPDFSHTATPRENAEAYVDDQLATMSRAEFLQRISDALDEVLPAALAAP